MLDTFREPLEEGHRLRTQGADTYATPPAEAEAEDETEVPLVAGGISAGLSAGRLCCMRARARAHTR